MNSEGSGLGLQIHGGLTSQWFKSTFCAFDFSAESLSGSHSTSASGDQRLVVPRFELKGWGWVGQRVRIQHLGPRLPIQCPWWLSGCPTHTSELHVTSKPYVGPNALGLRLYGYKFGSKLRTQTSRTKTMDPYVFCPTHPHPLPFSR